MATREDIYNAIRNADAAGDTAAVQKLGAYLKTLAPVQTPPIAGGVDPTSGNSFLDNAVIGVGKGMTSVGRALGLGGVAEHFGLPGTAAEADQTDAPLMQTAGGKVGNVVGKAAVTAPALLAPGINTYLGAAAIGAGTEGLTTEGNLADRLKAAGFGAAGGAAGKGIADAAGSALGYLANKAQNAFANASGKAAAAKNALDAGYVVPPTEISPGPVNSALEGLSGKIKTAQAASTKNQTVTNDLARQELGLPTDRPLTISDLNGIRQQAGNDYAAVANSGTITPGPAYQQALDRITAPYVKAAQDFPNGKVSPVVAEIDALRSPQFDAASAVAKIKTLREQADSAYAGGDKATGAALKGGADALENAIDAHLVQTGAPPDLLQKFRDARQLIAKTYSVQKGLNPVTGDVSATSLGAQLQAGKPLSGNLLTIAEANRAFPKATQLLPQSYNALSPLDYATAVIGGLPTHGLSALVPAARVAARSAILSGPYQRAALAMNGAPTVLPALARGANSEIANKLLPLLGIELSPTLQQ